MQLLQQDSNKQLIIDYLKQLSDEGLNTVYAFVIMPNHIHLIWQQNKLNGKESPKGSLLKYSSHEFLKILKWKERTGLVQGGEIVFCQLGTAAQYCYKVEYNS